jgi:hypothetical protein
MFMEWAAGQVVGARSTSRAIAIGVGRQDQAKAPCSSRRSTDTSTDTPIDDQPSTIFLLAVCLAVCWPGRAVFSLLHDGWRRQRARR